MKVSITKEWATDYRAVLAAAVDLSRGKDLIVVGHSLGAHIVAAGLPSHRNAVKRYVFVGGTNPHFETSPSAPALEMWKEVMQSSFNHLVSSVDAHTDGVPAERHTGIL